MGYLNNFLLIIFVVHGQVKSQVLCALHRGAPFSLAMHTSNGAWLFHSATTSTWSSQDMVLDLSVPSNQLMALSADVIKGWLCILAKCSVNLFNALATAIAALGSPSLLLTSGLKLCLLVGYLLSLWLYLAYSQQGLPGMGENWGVQPAAGLSHSAWWCWLLLFQWLATSSNWCISSLASLSGVLDLSEKLLLGRAWIEN